MYKKLLQYVIMFAIICSFCEYGLDLLGANQIASRSPVSLAFASIGAISQESRVDAWAKIESAQSYDEMLNTLQEILRSLKIPVKKYRIEKNTNHNQIQYYCVSDQIQYIISVKSDSQAGTTTANITIITENPEADLNQLSAALATMRNLSWKKSYRYTGLLEANIDSHGRMEIMKVLTQNLEVNASEYHADEKMIRCTGYSSIVSYQGDDLIQANATTNIQTAIRERQDKRSNIYIGVPSLFNALE